MPEYQLNSFLGSESVVKAVVDRALATERNRLLIPNYLSFEETFSPTFRSVYGTTTAARMGSAIDRNAPKPLRGRRPLGQAVLEVMNMGDRFQMDADRLEQLDQLIRRLNLRGGLDASATSAVTDILVDDFRELSIAPYKRMEKVLFDLLANGSASVKIGDNPKGVKILDMDLPVKVKKAQRSDKGHLIPFLLDIRNEFSYLNFGRMEMSQATFLKHFANSEELKGKWEITQGNTKASIAGMIPLEAVNALMASLGLPEIRVITNIVTDLGGKTAPLMPDDKIVFLPEGEIGKLRHYSPYEQRNRVPGKTYALLQGSHMISTERIDEGYTMEYSCSWIPEIRVPDNIVSIDLTAIK